MHLDLSPKHASTVPLVLNLFNGSIFPQFYAIFDDWLTTVDSSTESPNDSINSTKWTDLFLNERFSVEFGGDDPIELEDKWLSDLEKTERHEKAIAWIQSNGLFPSEILPAIPDLRSF